MQEVSAIVERASASLSTEEHATLKAAVETLALITQELESKNTSIERLRKMLFGAKTEKTQNIFSNTVDNHQESDQKKERVKKPGHGRNSAAAYTGANRIKVAHPAYSGGENCSLCSKGRIYPFSEPSQLVRITGMAPLGAAIYECERYRCNLCGEVFTAPAPDGVGETKYDETATSMVGLLKYGTGMPFYRIEQLQKGFGIPMPASTQWELVEGGAEQLVPVHKELINQAAQGKVLYNDDTTMKILKLTKEQRAAAAADNASEERTGIFTSGIVSTQEEHQIALFFTGVKHAGENLSDILAQRSNELGPPIQMCDALSRNTTGDFKTILSNCISHARRKYVDVASRFPEECLHVLEELSKVYKNDDTARKQIMSEHERLLFHQVNSEPIMTGLKNWMTDQIDGCKVEPNSGLGEAILYMQEHWVKLTLFLREPGAPLDNNICERALKKTILHRKNALFYRTLNGAHVGDIFMSLIHSAELNGIQPFDYLVALLKHNKLVAESPEDWMPWNYSIALQNIEPDEPP